MKTFAVFAFLAVIVAAVSGAAVEVEKPVPVESADVSPISGQESAAAPKEDLKGAETVYAALPYVPPAPVLPYAAYPYYRYAYPYGYPYAVPAAYYLRR